MVNAVANVINLRSTGYKHVFKNNGAVAKVIVISIGGGNWSQWEIKKKERKKKKRINNYFPNSPC
jgi:hypothetical protein